MENRIRDLTSDLPTKIWDLTWTGRSSEKADKHGLKTAERPLPSGKNTDSSHRVPSN